MKKVLLFLVGWLLLINQTNACFPSPGQKPVTDVHWIELTAQLDYPHYYYRTEYAWVFIPPSFVEAWDGPEELVHAILSVKPELQHEDIFAGVVLTRADMDAIHSLVADALAMGVALVYDSSLAEFAGKVKMVRENNICSGVRSFYYPQQQRYREILTVIDWIS